MDILQTGTLGRCGHRDLPVLIDLYDGNYLRVMRLFPELDSLEGTQVSRVVGALDLYVALKERFKHKTTLLLTYRFIDDAGIGWNRMRKVRFPHSLGIFYEAVTQFLGLKRYLEAITSRWLRRYRELDRIARSKAG